MSIALPTLVPDAPEAISLDSPHEVRYWTSRFEASAAQVAHAVEAVGSSPASVDAWLRESRTGGVVRQDGKWTFLQSAIRNLMFFATGLTGGVMLS